MVVSPSLLMASDFLPDACATFVLGYFVARSRWHYSSRGLRDVCGIAFHAG